MNSKSRIAASLVCADPLKLAEEVKYLEKNSVDYIHFDVMDNVFVPRLGLYPEILTELNQRSTLPVEVHLMTENPENLIPMFIEAGAEIITVHPESTNHLHRTITLIKRGGAKAGVVLNPATPLNILDYVIDDLSLVMFMGINPGILGHPFIPNTIEKIKLFRERFDLDVLLGVDGGVNFDTLSHLQKAGANYFVCGSATIFKKETEIGAQVKAIRKCLEHK